MDIISYQGVQGAFSYITAVSKFGKDNYFIGLETFNHVFEMVEKGEADYAIIPIENSLIGSIFENLDLLNHFNLTITGEQYTTIEHCLMGLPGNNRSLTAIKKVLSHPKALEQCSEFLKKHPWMESTIYFDTAAAAAEIANKNDSSYGAIASAFAAELYHLEIYERSIGNELNNYTRFIILAKDSNMPLLCTKCSLLVLLDHKPGTLLKFLSFLATDNFNLTKIESRPLKDRPFEYSFFIDFEFPERSSQEIKDKLEGQKNCKVMKILGLYHKGLFNF